MNTYNVQATMRRVKGEQRLVVRCYVCVAINPAVAEEHVRRLIGRTMKVDTITIEPITYPVCVQTRAFYV